jgi:2-iminobutanoate/2-iminopropanoate deaminase
MKPEVVRSEKMPVALGPYSHAMRMGDVLYVSGQTGIDPATGTVPEGGFEPEARQAFANLRQVLDAAGSSLARVAKVTVWLSDASDFPALNEVFAQFFTTDPPARSTPIVSLPRALRISIEAIAGAGDD